MSKLHQENESNSSVSSSSCKDSQSEASGRDTSEIGDGSTYQSEYGTPLQNCTEILNEILNLSLQLSDNEHSKSELNSIYLSFRNSADDNRSNLTSYKTLTPEVKEMTMLGASEKENTLVVPTPIVVPVLISNKQELGLNQEDIKKVNFKEASTEIPKGVESKTKSLVHSEQKSGASIASDPEEIVNDALKNNLVVKEVNDSLDLVDTYTNTTKRSGSPMPFNFTEWANMEEVVTQIHYSKETYDEASQVNLPFPDMNLLTVSDTRSLTGLTSGDHASTQVSCPENISSGEFRTYRISEYDLPPNYSSIIQSDTASYREMNRAIPLSMILSRYGEPRPSVPFIYRIPPPSYDESEFINTEISLPSLAISSPFWGPKPQAALCHVCSAFCVTSTRYRINFGTHMFAFFLCICLCWPCCLLPYYTPACKYTEHFCPNCQTLLGIYDPCRNSGGTY